MKIKTKISLFALLISLVPLLVISVLSIVNARKMMLDQIQNGLAGKALLVGSEIDTFFHQRSSDIRILSQADVIESEDRDAMGAYLAEVRNESPVLTGLAVFDAGGKALAASGFGAPAVLPDWASPLFRSALSASQGDVFMSEATRVRGALGVLLLTPITDASNIRVIRILAMHVDLDPVKDRVTQFDETIIGDKSVYICDNDGNVVVTADASLSPLAPLPDLAAYPSLLDALGDDNGFVRYTDVHGDDVIAGYVDMAEFGQTEALDWSMLAIAPVKEIAAPVTVLTRMITLIACAIAVLVGGLSLWAAGNLTRPMMVITDTLKDISKGEGDLTVRIAQKSQDEIGMMAFFFNRFVEKLHQMMIQISEDITTLSNLSGNMASIAKDLSKGSDQTSERADAVSSASEAMSADMHSVAAAMEESSMNITAVAGASEEMYATMNEISQNTGKARTFTEQAVEKTGSFTETMEELSGSAKAIGQIVGTITEISEQVNMLSLNATIEAARAGEAGKGFAVVANEIKDLARQTSEASLDIRQKIESVQKSAEGSSVHIVEISNVITSVNDIVSAIASAVEEQSSATSEISQNIGQASGGLAEVNLNVNRSTSAATDITGKMHTVRELSAGITEKGGEVQQSADELERLVGKLEEMVGQFKL